MAVRIKAISSDMAFSNDVCGGVRPAGRLPQRAAQETSAATIT
jgi:hypothetical protein